MQTIRTSRRTFTTAMASLALGGALAACSGRSKNNDKKLTIGFIPSWSDGLSMSHLVKVQLEKNDYTIEFKDLSEPGPLYTGLGQGDIDLYPSAWPEVTHKQYMEKYSDSIEDLGSYYGGAKLTWSVPSYSAMKSITDIPDHASEIGNKIIGIEPGAGITDVSKNDVIPAYGLDSMELVTSSTNAMITDLSSAVDAREEIVVTLWHPFWANERYDMRDLEDPKGALGEGEGLHFLGRKDFSKDFPEVAEWLKGFKLEESQYGALEDLVVNQYGKGKEDEAVAKWSEDYPQFDFKKS